MLSFSRLRLTIPRLIVLALPSSKISSPRCFASHLARATLCSSTEVTLSTGYSDESCSGTPTNSYPYVSTDCNTGGDSPGRTFSLEREVVATNYYYSAAGCAESDKLSTSMSMPAGCKATGTATSASSEKYEASGNDLTYTTYSSSDCTGTAVTTTAIPCGTGTCTAFGSIWSKMVMTCPLQLQAAPWCAWNCPC